LVQAVFDLRMGRDDEPVDSMEIDSQKQQRLEALTAVPEGFSADYLRIYYGKLIRSLIMAWNGEDKLKQDRHLLSVHNYMFSVVIIDSAQS